MRRAFLGLFASLLIAAPALAQDAELLTPAPETQSPAADPTLLGPVTNWQVCNETSYVVRLSAAFLRGGRMVAKGWTEVLPGACGEYITPVDSPRFLFAESSDVHQGGIREWKGDTALCVAEDDFESDATEDCALANRLSRDYFAVRPGEPVTTLVEPGGFGREGAVIAVQQRLLRDAGYPMSRIDGLPGRATSSTLRKFRRAEDLEATITDEPLLRALIGAAREAKQSVGLEVCNESSATVWSALATRTDGTWRSRGWWRTDAGTCTRPLDSPLIGTEAHVYAVQARDGAPDRRLRTVATTPAQFCISEARFDALGNEYCAEKGYAVGAFRPVPTENPGARMRLSDSDFADPDPVGLRR